MGRNRKKKKLQAKTKQTGPSKLWGEIDEKTRRVLEEADARLEKLHKRERTAPYLIGKEYLRVKKEELPRGFWMKWLKEKQYTSQSTANAYMAICRVFAGAEDAALFSVVQQQRLTRKDAKKTLAVFIQRAKNGEKWTNEEFIIELEIVKRSTRSGAEKKDAGTELEELSPQEEHKRWFRQVEGLLSALEALLNEDRWHDRRAQVPKPYAHVRKRLKVLRSYFKLPTVGSLPSG